MPIELDIQLKPLCPHEASVKGFVELGGVVQHTEE